MHVPHSRGKAVVHHAEVEAAVGGRQGLHDGLQVTGCLGSGLGWLANGSREIQSNEFGSVTLILGFDLGNLLKNYK